MLVDRRGRRYLVELAEGAIFHTHLGMIPHDEVIGTRVGSFHLTSGGASLLAIKPRPMDYVLKMRRSAQVIYPKDFGAIIWRTGIRPGARILEVGLGSGAMTVALLLATGEKGSVVSFDLRWDHAERAVSNISRFFKSRSVDHRVVIGDAAVCLKGEEIFDAAVVDVAEPWTVLEATTRALRTGSFVACFSPSTVQVGRTVSALEDLGYEMLETVEVLERGWYVKGNASRPEHRMVAHTGFVTVGCKTLPPAGS